MSQHQVVKVLDRDTSSVYNVEGLGLIPGLGRSPGEGNVNPLQYYCLENPMDRGAWKATAHGVAKSRTRLNDFNLPYVTLPYSAYKLNKQHDNIQP